MTGRDRQTKASATSEPVPAQMNAIVQDRYGGPDVLSLRHAPTPTPGPEQVLIRVEASSLNVFDVHMTTGYPLMVRLSEARMFVKGVCVGRCLGALSGPAVAGGFPDMAWWTRQG